jgi:hypothetical protein
MHNGCRIVRICNHTCDLYDVPWIYEHLTVESSANFRDLEHQISLKESNLQSNERNSNHNSVKENVETRS